MERNQTARGVPCPCGGRAYRRAELIEMAQEQCSPTDDANWIVYWESTLGPDDFYCPDEDDVLLPSEVPSA